jgi:hypothetical protein
MAIPPRLDVAGARRGCVGGVVGAAFGWAPCGGFAAGVAGAWALSATTLATMKLNKNGVRMMHIIYGSRRV